MRLGRFVLFAVAVAGMAAPAMAQPRGRFLHPADTNGDERLSRSEWKASGESVEGFRAADANRDGVVTGQEFANWFMAKEGISPIQASAHRPAGAVDRIVQR
ncbi:MAG TPA: hypothetical protein VIO94_01150 [Phenylobacterium sp.]